MFPQEILPLIWPDAGTARAWYSSLTRYILPSCSLDILSPVVHKTLPSSFWLVRYEQGTEKFVGKNCPVIRYSQFRVSRDEVRLQRERWFRRTVKRLQEEAFLFYRSIVFRAVRSLPVQFYIILRALLDISEFRYDRFFDTSCYLEWSGSLPYITIIVILLDTCIECASMILASLCVRCLIYIFLSNVIRYIFSAVFLWYY